MDIIDLPNDLFLLVVAQLSPRTAVLCRRVSRRWREAFAGEDLSLHLLKWHFPRCREARSASYSSVDADAAGGGAMWTANGGGGGGGGVNTSWAAVFAAVASRYHHLRAAAPMSVEKLRQGGARRPPGKSSFVPVGTWDRHLRLDDRTAPFHYSDPGWCYGQEDGLLVYHQVHGAAGSADEWATCPWRLFDLETREEAVIPFAQGTDKIVRRVRLSDGVLIFEWRVRDEAEDQPYNEEECHRHFVTAYDVVRVQPAATDSNDTCTWAITQRAQFETGFTIDRYGRFFSAHTATHYAVYFWQPDHLAWGGDDTGEAVFIWDISTRERPRLLRRIDPSALAFYGVRQEWFPRLRGIDLDDGNLYFTEEEHRWAQGNHASPSPPRVHVVRSTAVPVIPVPSSPESREEDGSKTRGSGQRDAGTGNDVVVVQGPSWVDLCGADGDANMSFCSRAGDLLYHHDGGALTDPPRTTLAAASRSSSSINISNTRAPAARRWPGLAPCWRHEEFPYLTVSEAVDLQAGVRFTARDCFMLETLSVHVRPSLSVRALGRVTTRDDNDGGGGHDGKSNSRRAGGTGLDGRAGRQEGAGSDEREKGSEVDEGDGNEEVQFADGLWDALLGKGFICGDERWLIGEDTEGSITILRF